MKTSLISAFVVCICLLILSSSGLAAESVTYYACGSESKQKVAVYETCDANEPCGYLLNGCPVDITGYSEEQSRVSFNLQGFTGWIAASDVVVTPIDDMSLCIHRRPLLQDAMCYVDKTRTNCIILSSGTVVEVTGWVNGQYYTTHDGNHGWIDFLFIENGSYDINHVPACAIPYDDLYNKVCSALAEHYGIEKQYVESLPWQVGYSGTIQDHNVYTYWFFIDDDSLYQIVVDAFCGTVYIIDYIPTSVG